MRLGIILTSLVLALTTLVVTASYSAESYKAYKVSVPPNIDGDLSEWANVPGVFLTGSTTKTGELDGKDLFKNWETLGVETWTSDADLSATWYVTWDDNNLYFACLVKDEKHENKGSGDSIWNGDGIQFTIDPTNAKKDYFNVVYEYGFALTTKPSVWRWSTNTATKGENSKFNIVRDDSAGTTKYEIAIPEGDIAPAELVAGNVLGFSVIINENDVSGGQGGWLGWYPHAIVYGKNAGKLGDLILSEEIASAVQPIGKITTTWGDMKR